MLLCNLSSGRGSRSCAVQVCGGAVLEPRKALEHWGSFTNLPRTELYKHRDKRVRGSKHASEATQAHGKQNVSKLPVPLTQNLVAFCLSKA